MATPSPNNKRTIDQITPEIYQIPIPRGALHPRLRKVISGGQSGADRAALEAAHALGLKTGGWAPYNFMTSKGKAPELESKFKLKRIPDTINASAVYSYILRSKLNVDDSDATLVFKIKDSTGTDKTVGYAATKEWKLLSSSTQKRPIVSNYKPLLILTDSVNPLFNDGTDQLAAPSRTWLLDAEALYNFLATYKVRTLNVAGHSQNDKNDPTWQTRVYNFLLFALQRMKKERVVLDTAAISEVPTPEEGACSSSN